MSSSDELLAQDVREEFAKSRSYFRVARTLDISLAKVKAILGDRIAPIQRRKALFGGLGRPELAQYRVCVKHVDEPWDNSIEEIVEARDNYENGTHEMCTGRDGDNLILYSIPRTKAAPNPGYFSGEYLG